jgi:hypothetical protein
MEITPRRICTNACPHCRGNSIVADALSRLEKDEDEPISETEEGLVLSHEVCAVEQQRRQYSCQKPKKNWL